MSREGTCFGKNSDGGLGKRRGGGAGRGLGGSEPGKEGEGPWGVGEVEHACGLLGEGKKGQGEGAGGVGKS